MSKSLGNSLLVTGVLSGFRQAELRYYLVQAHYRSLLGTPRRRWKRRSPPTSG